MGVQTKNRLEDQTLPLFEDLSIGTITQPETNKDFFNLTINKHHQKPINKEKQNIKLKRDELKLSKNSEIVLKNRYLKKNFDGQACEAPEDMFRRVAKNIAEGDLLYDSETDITDTEIKFYNMMVNLEFLPNSPTLMNAGRKLQQLSACFVLPVEDSMEGIYESLKNAALIHKSGGGTGFSFTRLRPQNTIVATTRGVSSGPISFMKVFNSSTESIKQGGTRRGANMGILNIDHPDILDFIKCKQSENSLTNFNISVAITEDFMEKVEQNETYNLINPHTKEVEKTLNARMVLKKIVKLAWSNGEPGIIFIDRINKDNPTPHIGKIESTNPCGEQPLLPYEACNLGSINLNQILVKNENNQYSIDYNKLENIVETSVHFLDNVIDKSEFPIKEITEMVRGNRKIGLGIMGWADMLYKLKIPYSSFQAEDLAKKIMKFITEKSKSTSIKLAKKRGVFKNYKNSIYDKIGLQVRNATTTTIAPTGTLSIIANCSGGIEPVFALCYERNILDGKTLVEVHPYFKKVAKERGFYSKKIMKQIAEQGSLKNIDGIPEDVKQLFLTSKDVNPEWHVKIQAAFQQYTDNAVSKTVNLPNDATIEDVEKTYWLAYKLGCKGITIYRDGSREVQVLTTNKKEQKAAAKIEKEKKVEPLRKRPEITTGKTIRMMTGCGYLYVTINEDENGICELFTTMGKAGGCQASQSEAIGRLISLLFRSGFDGKSLIKHLKGISCPQPVWQAGTQVLSCADALAKSLELYLKEKENHEKPEPRIVTKKKDNKTINTSQKTVAKVLCPTCSSSLEFSEGCVVCRSCGYSKCT